MAAITWRNINAPNQSAAAQLARQGSTALTSGIAGIGEALQRHQDREKAAAATASGNAAQDLINQIKGYDSTKLAEAKASGAFSPEALAQLGINPKDTGSVLDSLSTQDDRIFAEGQQQVERDNTLRTQAADTKTRGDVNTLENILRDRELDTGAKRDKIAALAQTNNISSDLVTKYDDLAKREGSLDQLTDLQKMELQGKQQAQVATQEAQVNQLEQQLTAAQARVPKNPVKGTEEYAQDLQKFNKGIEDLRKGDRWFPLANDLEDVKQEAISTADKLGASPSQALAAFGQVVDGDGDYSSDAFEAALKEIVDDPAAEQNRIKAAQLQDALNRVKINAPKSQHIQRQALVQDFINKRFQ